MPTVMRRGGFRVFFYAADRVEPPHVHVAKQSCEAKFWLAPVELALNDGFASQELTKIRTIIIENREYLWEVWLEFFGT
ncbi:DUF4160 domain-containing protein [Humibacter antri]